MGPCLLAGGEKERGTRGRGRKGGGKIWLGMQKCAPPLLVHPRDLEIVLGSLVRDRHP